MYRFLINLFGLSFRRRQPWRNDIAHFDVNAVMARDRARFERRRLLALQVCTKSEK